MKQNTIMILNLGSTSYKFKLFRGNPGEERVLAEGGFENIGSVRGRWFLNTEREKTEDVQGFADHMEAFLFSVEKLAAAKILSSLSELTAVGYKSVHGGAITGARRIDEEILDVMEKFSPLAPAHNPVYIRMMRQIRSAYPDLVQIGCFETSFHAAIPEKRAIYGVPKAWKEELGIRKYGFHGSSHSYIALKMQKEAPELRKIISLHLGGSSSVCAILDGKSIAASMGATPQSGVFQNNRVGDFDIFCLPALMEQYGGDWQRILKILSSEGGLLGVSGVSNDFREIEKAAGEGNADAALAIDAFVDGIAGYVGMFQVYLKGLDALVFTGGIGLGSTLVRKKVCEELAFLGGKIDDGANLPGKEGKISSPSSKVPVFVLKTNEELMVLRQCVKLLENGAK